MSTPATPTVLPDISGYTLVTERHWGRWVAVAIMVVLLAALARAFAIGQIEWVFVGQFLTAKSILDGLVNTILMTIGAMTLGITLGIVTAVMRMSPNPC